MNSTQGSYFFCKVSVLLPLLPPLFEDNKVDAGRSLLFSRVNDFRGVIGTDHLLTLGCGMVGTECRSGLFFRFSLISVVVVMFVVVVVVFVDVPLLSLPCIPS